MNFELLRKYEWDSDINVSDIKKIKFSKDFQILEIWTFSYAFCYNKTNDFKEEIWILENGKKGLKHS